MHQGSTAGMRCLVQAPFPCSLFLQVSPHEIKRPSVKSGGRWLDDAVLLGSGFARSLGIVSVSQDEVVTQTSIRHGATPRLE